MNQKVSTGLGTAILLVMVFTAGYFVWMIEKNNQQSIPTPQVAIIKKIPKADTVESAKNEVKEVTTKLAMPESKEIADLKSYKNEKYGYEINYSEDKVEIVLDDFFERGSMGNPSFRIKNGGHFAVGVWDNPENLTSEEWIDEQYAEYSGGWPGDFKETIVGKEKAYSALRTDMCYIEWIIIPKLNRFYTFGVELCDENINVSLKTFKEIVSSFKFIP